MDSHDYPVAHFELMRELAKRLKQLPAQILDHSYSYEAFGSWSVTLRYKDRVSRFSLDGRDGAIVLEQSAAPKAPYAWKNQLWLRPTSGSMDPIATICNALLQSDESRR
jgi:hypothetical protein